MKQKIQRDSNLELLRIVAMIFIVLHHFIVHGCQLAELASCHPTIFPKNDFTLSAILLICNSFFYRWGQCLCFNIGVLFNKDKMENRFFFVRCLPVLRLCPDVFIRFAYKRSF